MRILDTKITNKNILITGGLGFVGSHFIELLDTNCENCEIHVYDNFSTTISYLVAELLIDLNAQSNNNIAAFHLDINDTNEVEYDYIVNLAEYNGDEDDECIVTNIMSTYNLLSKCKKSCKFLQISSAKVYGDNVIANTDAYINPKSIYGASKACADILAKTFVNKYNKNISIVRLPNIFGPRQLITKFIPNTILEAKNDIVINIDGNDDSSNQWIYIADCCIQLLGAMIYGEKGEIYHMIPLYTENMPCTNIKLVKTILKCMGKGEYLIAKDNDINSPPYQTALTGKNLLQLLILNKFPARGRTLENDLRETITWYEKNKNWWA